MPVIHSHPATPAPAFLVKIVRPTLSGMRFGLDRLSFEDGAPATRIRREGGMVVLPDFLFEGHVKEIMERAIRDHFRALDARCSVGTFFTGRYGGSSSAPTFSRRSPTIHVQCGAVDLAEFSRFIAIATGAETALVVPWNSSDFQILSLDTPT
jgi:hypothetical protein